MPGTPPTRGTVRPGDMAEDYWEDVPAVADRDVVRFTDREIETLVVAVTLGVIGAAVLVGVLALRRRPTRA